MTEKDGQMFIKDVFEQFLSEQQSKLAPKTYRDYASVIELFAHQLDGYAWNNIPDGTQAYNAAQKKGRSFIDLYDHTHIESNVREPVMGRHCERYGVVRGTCCLLRAESDWPQ